VGGGGRGTKKKAETRYSLLALKNKKTSFRLLGGRKKEISGGKGGKGKNGFSTFLVGIRERVCKKKKETLYAITREGNGKKA